MGKVLYQPVPQLWAASESIASWKQHTRKSYLISGHGHLLALFDAAKLMVKRKENACLERAASMQVKQRLDFLGKARLGNLTTVTYTAVAVDLIARQ